MKKILLSVCLCIPIISFAQTKKSIPTFAFGLKAGGNLSHQAIGEINKEWPNENKFGWAWYAGAFSEISFPANPKWQIRLEAMYNSHALRNTISFPTDIGTKATYDDATSLKQISIPLILKYNLFPQLSISAGASANINLSSKTLHRIRFESEEMEFDHKKLDQLTAFQVGLLADIAVNISKHFAINGRYNYYLGNTIKETFYGTAFKTSDIHLGLNYTF